MIIIDYQLIKHIRNIQFKLINKLFNQKIQYIYNMSKYYPKI